MSKKTNYGDGGLQDLRFGAPAAERDMAFGLADYFVESEGKRSFRGAFREAR